MRALADTDRDTLDEAGRRARDDARKAGLTESDEDRSGCLVAGL